MYFKRRSILRLTCATALLSACASEHAAYTKPGRAPDQTAYQADVAECSRVGSSNMFDGAARGVGYFGDEATSGNNPLEAIGILIVGPVLGFFDGALKSGGGDNYDLCMARKGYQRVDSQQAEAPAP